MNLLLLLQIRPPDRLDIPRSTIRLGWHGWDPKLAQATAPLGVPKRPPPQPPAQRLVLWTAPPIPGRRKHCYPGWGLNPGNADDVPFLRAMISWWNLRKPMHSANMMPDTAPLRELNRSVLSPRHLCPQVLPVPQTQTLHWISTQWIGFLRQISGPDTGSLHFPLDIHQATVCATSVGFGNASLRLLSWKPVRAVPGPKSGPRFFMPSWENSCQARGVRVVGYLASGPTGAAILVLRQQVLITAKLRGRHSIFLFGVIAASPCCTWYTGQSTEVQVLYRGSALHDQHAPSPRPAHSLLVSPPLHCTGGNGMSLLQCKSRSVPAIFRSGLSMCIRYLASRLCLPKHVRRGGTGSRYLRGLGIGSASGCQWFPDERPCDLAPAREARTRNRHPWLRALASASLRCRRFVQLLPRRGAPRWTSPLLKLGGSFREQHYREGITPDEASSRAFQALLRPPSGEPAPQARARIIDVDVHGDGVYISLFIRFARS